MLLTGGSAVDFDCLPTNVRVVPDLGDELLMVLDRLEALLGSVAVWETEKSTRHTATLPNSASSRSSTISSSSPRSGTTRTFVGKQSKSTALPPVSSTRIGNGAKKPKPVPMLSTRSRPVDNGASPRQAHRGVWCPAGREDPDVHQTPHHGTAAGLRSPLFASQTTRNWAAAASRRARRLRPPLSASSTLALADARHGLGHPVLVRRPSSGRALAILRDRVNRYSGFTWATSPPVGRRSATCWVLHVAIGVGNVIGVAIQREQHGEIGRARPKPNIRDRDAPSAESTL